MERIVEIINNDKVANVFFNLYERWLDEWKYDDINEYGKVIADAIVKHGADVVLKACTQKPFGIKVEFKGEVYHLYIKRKGSSAVLCSNTISIPKPEHKPLPKLVSAYEYCQMNEEERKSFVRPGFIYAHGKLDDDMKTDVFNINIDDKDVVDGLKAEYNGKECVFHLYQGHFGHLTGIVTYSDDEEACDYGRKLKEEKPVTF